MRQNQLISAHLTKLEKMGVASTLSIFSPAGDTTISNYKQLT